MSVYMELGSGTVIETDNPEFWKEGTRITAAEGKRRIKADAIAHLRKILRPGTVVYTGLLHVSRSGMSRRIKVVVIRKNEPTDITGWVARAFGEHQHRNGGVVMGGCGMDMGFALVNNLSYDIHGWDSKGDGAKPENNGTPFKARPGHYRAGYSLEHRWL